MKMKSKSKTAPNGWPSVRVFSLIQSCFKDVKFWGRLKAAELCREEECIIFLKNGMNQVRMFQKIISERKLFLTHKKNVTEYKESLLFTAFTADSCLLFTQEYTNREEKRRDLESQRMYQWWMCMYWVCKFYWYLLKPKTYMVIAHLTLQFLYIQCTFLIMKSDSCITFIEESLFIYITMSADLVWICNYSKSTRLKSAITSVSIPMMIKIWIKAVFNSKVDYSFMYKIFPRFGLSDNNYTGEKKQHQSIN